jgi:hypothetical protein
MRHAVALGLSYLGLAAFAARVFFISEKSAHIPQAIWPYVAGAGAISAALAGALVWLAVYSADHGYDDRFDPEGEPQPWWPPSP